MILEQDGGTVANVSSVATRRVSQVPYGATKDGVSMLVVCLVFEAADQGIHVSAVAPGDTDMPP